MATADKVDPVHQFIIHDLIPLGNVADMKLAFQNSSLFMFVAVALIVTFMMVGTKSRKLVPGRLQSTVEMLYEFMAGTVRQVLGEEGMKFLPFVFSLFTFILTLNLLGLVPYFFTVTSQIVVTASLAILVILTVIIVGFVKNGPKFMLLFVPSGVPLILLPLISLIEFISFFARPVSLSLRLFGNMLAGHIVLKVFAGFVGTLGAMGFLGVVGAIAPFLMTIAITALEFLVAGLQAFVFAVLTCVYLKDALHPHH
ncbi:F-ATPase subunit 6 [Hartmannibacter diazotrophicus]|uniref:ATP synthase subunit a n=1 Tax=Hartmannibacter diazotrophicus TaxID=1482074 RepID=A0A2C9D338_9HYPH|nr:F0F1 ATP synthase subunit A [Hartmannibacter diazotrophicus]SON54680.1 F-ATPase subunit 6 [Hartmannibacter diazotrophicus]